MLLGLDDGNAIEAILISTFGPRVKKALELEEQLGFHASAHLPFMQKKIRYETCVSTQVGCALDCHFCASSLVPFARNMTAEELAREIETVESLIPEGGALAK